MNARTLRRAMERKARKASKFASNTGTDARNLDTPQWTAGSVAECCELAANAAKSDEGSAATAAAGRPLPEGIPSDSVAAVIGSRFSLSEARLAANGRNAEASTGPKTEAGKQRSKLNALKTGLTGRTVLLPADDADRYGAHVEAWVLEYKPVGLRECFLVQSIADSYWRAERIVRLEFALFASGTEPSSAGEAASELDTLLRYEKQLRNLHIQEARLNRQREKDKKELATLQAERREREGEQDAERSRLQKQESAAAKSTGIFAGVAAATGTQKAHGFEFATAQTQTDAAPSHMEQSSGNGANERQSIPAVA